jgi:tetratricopeptide (TPR) repeat protein
VLRWYRAVGAWLLEHRLQAIAVAHMREAQRLFPRDRDVNLLAGLLHESLARAAGWTRLETGLDGSRELEAARRALRRAVDADPRSEVAQLHLARVSHLLGDNDAARAAAAVVLAQGASPANRYVAELLMGSVHQAAQRVDEARASYERAAALYPTAQSPLVAPSHLARASGHRREAVRAVERLTALPHDIQERPDPWWEYESRAVREFGPLLDDLRDELTRTEDAVTRGVRLAAVSVVAAMSASLLAAAQAPTFSARTRAVRIDVLATSGGRPVTGLGADDFEVRDNGVVQQVDLVSFDEVPLTLVLALDVSDSVSGERLTHLRQAAAAVLRDLRDHDQAALITFSHAIVVHGGLTRDRAAVDAALARVEPRGGTAIVDAVQSAIVSSANPTRGARWCWCSATGSIRPVGSGRRSC